MKRFLTATALACLALGAPIAAQTDLGPLNLPAGPALPMPIDEDFEAAAGVVPGYMALTELDVATLLPDPDAWANIGNRAPCLNPFSGSYNLEMGLIPGSTNYHDVRNAMVLLIDATGWTGSTLMSFQAIDGGEETDTVDGVWVSDTGTGASWYAVTGSWGSTVGPTNAWDPIRDVDWASTPANTAGQFYLAFVQEDNFPYLDLDGIGIDDIVAPQPLYSPSYTVGTLTGGQYTTAQVDGGPAGGTATYIVSFTGLGSDPFQGVTTDLAAPIRAFAQLPLDTVGTSIFAGIVPPNLSGTTIYHQAITTDGIGAWLTNTVTSFIN